MIDHKLSTILKKISKLIFLFPTSLFLMCFSSCKDNSINTTQYESTIHDTYPIWSPDGTEIIYVGQDGINIIDTNGNNKRQISSEYFEDLAWSPDGLWIAYQSHGDIYKKKIHYDTITVRLTFTGHNFTPSWSKDGQFIAYDSNDEDPEGNIMHFIWRIRTDGTERKRIIFTPELGDIRDVSWFPDGIKLAVARYVGPSTSREIAIIDTTGNSIAVLTNDSENDITPKVSNNGSMIVWKKDRNHGEIYTMNPDGSNTKIVTDYGLYPNWSPNGEKIVYTNTSPGDGRIWTMNKNGMAKKKLTY